MWMWFFNVIICQFAIKYIVTPPHLFLTNYIWLRPWIVVFFPPGANLSAGFSILNH